MNPYWLLRAFVKTSNISHAATTGLESAGEKQLNPTVPELVEEFSIYFPNLLKFIVYILAFVKPPTPPPQLPP